MIITQDEVINNVLVITVLLFNYFHLLNLLVLYFLQQRFVDFEFMEVEIQGLFHIIKPRLIIFVIH